MTESINIKAIKRRLIVHSVVGFGVLAVLVGITFVLSTLSDSYLQQKQTVENEVNTLVNEISTLRAKYAKVKGNTGIYQEMMKKTAHNQLALDRQALRDHFNGFRSKYYLTFDNILAESVKPLKNYKGTSSRIVFSEVSVPFNAMTDVDVYNMLQSMQEALPGIARVTSFTLRQESKPSSENLAAVAKSGGPTFITGDLKFTWFGIEHIDKNSPDAQKSN